MILCFGLIRPYKGVDVLLEAFRSIEGAELWVVGRPLGMSLDPLRELAARAAGRVRFVPRFVSDRELPAYFRRADLVVLPHRDAEQSGVLYAALAFAQADRDERRRRLRRGGRAHGAGRLVPPGDPAALAAALERAARRPRRPRAAVGRRPRRRAPAPTPGTRSPAQTLALYRELLG